MAMTFRDTVWQVVPNWLRNTFAAAFLYALISQFDLIIELATAAIKYRMPGLYSDQSLPLIGRDRRIRRGPLESATTYGLRLRRWRKDHKTRGNPYTMLAQLFAYYDGNHFPVRLVYRSGRAFDMDVSGDVVMSDVTWNPDPYPARWARWWLILNWPTPVPAVRKYGQPGLKYGGGSTYGSGFTSQEVYALRAIPREWNSAHALGRILVFHGAIYGYPPHLYGDGLTYGSTTKVSFGVN